MKTEQFLVFLIDKRFNMAKSLPRLLGIYKYVLIELDVSVRT